MNDPQTCWQALLADPCEATFTTIYQQTRGLVWTLCIRILGNEEDARDAFQAVYSRLMTAVTRGGIPAGAAMDHDPSQLLYRLAIREAQNLQRRLARRAAREVAMEQLEPIPSSERAADTIAAQRQLREQLETMVGLLPEPIRLPVQLHYFHGLSQVEISRILNITQGNTSRRIAKGLKRLEPLLRRAGLTEALPGLAILGTAGVLLEAPEALSAGVVYAHAQATLAAGGAVAASGMGALTGKLSLGAMLIKKAAILSGVALLGLGALMAGKQLVASESRAKSQKIESGGGIAAAKNVGGATPVASITPAPTPQAPPVAAAPLQKPDAPISSPATTPPKSAIANPATATPSAQGSSRGTPVMGRIVDAETRKPIPGAEVTLIDKLKGRTDAQGAYLFPNVRPGSVSAAISAAGYVDRKDLLDFGGSDTNALDFALDPATTITLQVRDERGTPITSASIEMKSVMPPPKTLPSTFSPYGQGVRRMRKTDAHGVAVAGKMSRIRPLEITVTCFGFRMPGQAATTETIKGAGPHLTARKPVTIQPAQLGATITLVMERIKDLDRVVEGRIIDDKGNPIPLVQVQRMAPLMAERIPARTLTDETGRYRLAFQSETPDCYLCALAEGWAPAMQENVRTGTPAQPAEINFTLQPGHRLSGIVVDEAGKPVARARLMAAPSRKLLLANYFAILRQTETGSDGTFTLTGLTSQTVALSVSGPREDTRSMGVLERRQALTRVLNGQLGSSWPTRVLEKQAVDCSVTLALQSPIVMRGRVLDRESGQPVSSFRISGMSESGQNTGGLGGIYMIRPQTFKAGDGCFELHDSFLEPGVNYQLVVRGEGYMLTQVAGFKAEPASSSTEHIIRLTKGRALRGVVLDAATKAPVKEAKVYFASDGNNFSGETLPPETRGPKRNVIDATTGADGRFSFKEDLPGLLMIVAKGYRHVLVRPNERNRYTGGTGELWIPLMRGEQVSGACLENGRPAKAGSFISMRLQGEPVVLADIPFCDFSFHADIDAAGKFTFDDLHPGTYLMRQQWRPADLNSKLCAYAQRRVTIKKGEHKTVDIGDDQGSFNFIGRLLDAQGKPVNGVNLRLKPAFPWSYESFEALVIAHSSYDGRFHFPNLKPGKYNVEAAYTREDFTEEITPLEPIVISGDTERELRVPK